MSAKISYDKLSDEGRERLQDLIRQKRNQLGPEHHDDIDAFRQLAAERPEAVTASREAAELAHYFEHPDAIAPKQVTAAVGLGTVTDECACHEK